MKQKLQFLAMAVIFFSIIKSVAQSSSVLISGANIVSSGAVTIVYNGGNFTNNGTITNTDGTLFFSDAVTFNGVGTTTTKNLNVAHLGTSTLNNRITMTGSLTVSSGTLNANNNLTLVSNTAGTAVVDKVGGAITGNVTAQRYIPSGHRAYRLLSPPVTTTGSIYDNWQEGATNGIINSVSYGTHITGTGGSTQGFDSSAGDVPSLFTHNNTGTPAAWNAITNTFVNTLAAGSPYLIYIRGSRLLTNLTSTTNDATTLRGTGVLKTGTVNVSGLNTNANGFSLVGNPYQALVDMKAVLAAGRTTNLNTQYYYILDPTLNSGRGTYVTNDLALDTNNFNLFSKTNQYLQPWQGFFLKTIANGAASLSFTENDKSNDKVQTAVFRTANTTPALLRLFLYDTAKGGNPLDGLLVAFDAIETNNVNQNDAAKMTNLDENMATSNNGNLLSIEKRAIPIVTDEIPLNITNYRGTSYKITTLGTGLTGPAIYLLDTFTSTTTAIPSDGTVDYPFIIDIAVPASAASNRFKLIYTTTLNASDQTDADFALYPNPSKANSFNVVVPQSWSKTSLTVSNLLGQKIYSQKELAPGSTIKVTVSNIKSAGIYLVTLNSEEKTVTTKWVFE